MTYLELIRTANQQLNNGNITIGEYEKMLEPLKQEVQSIQTEQKLIKCKDCNEWHRGKTHNGIDICSDNGYCSVHRIGTRENYYCGDAESLVK